MIKPVEPVVSLIVAMARNRVIGRDNQLPWHLPGDLKYFKAVTMGKPIVMGRKTFESIGKPLPGRANIVVTSQRDFCAAGVSVAHSPDEALRVARKVAMDGAASEVMIIGGGRIYQEMLPLASRLYLTEVQADIEGDAFFPALDWAQWRQQSREDFKAAGSNPYDYSFVVYNRL